MAMGVYNLRVEINTKLCLHMKLRYQDHGNLQSAPHMQVFQICVFCVASSNLHGKWAPQQVS